MSEKQPRPWQVWWTDFDPQVGHEQAGLRPAVIVSTSFECALPNGLIIVVPCTTTDRELPYQPQLSSLNRTTFAMCDHVKSISQQRLRRPHRARLTPDEINKIKFVLRGIIDIN
ncbi:MULTISPECIES: type II toxin-antitoxin system PemK/MazF family toxin [unclassified Actinopolyspora]|uniref:type II toxin-antitoxin system PemK/MazF family toxin n=1 Tax=unclassified Actinopolyspora TaxID=2639451 RepID=UPI0013F5E58A|nr:MULTISPECIES: type II toxin-antitoxin system PemK/MazF family toxin [unclassified Actinopolyspora]NHD18957.1 type II toxin-antitoxin system PemK/MazF family toxin [Actinopolyspora sp. BKK2]NHE77380.1 type II toxin-antitoxin system PemK/MazF family toxin [Actinopolyspora sp. BKK1]